MENSSNLKLLTNFFFSKYQTIIKYIIYKTPGVKTKIINLLKPELRGEAWKGIILSQIIQSKPIKKYI